MARASSTVRDAGSRERVVGANGPAGRVAKAWAGVAALAALLGVLACATAGSSGAGAAAAGSAQASGEQMYRSHCGACHRLRDPSERTRDEWAAAVAKYGPRAHLADEDRPKVVEYLQAHAKDAGK